MTVSVMVSKPCHTALQYKHTGVSCDFLVKINKLIVCMKYILKPVMTLFLKAQAFGWDSHS